MHAGSTKWYPSDAWVRFLLAPVLVFLALLGDRNLLADFWHHLARGQVILEQGHLLDHDIFTYTVHGQPFQDVNWLTQVGYAWLFGLGGLLLVQFVNALLVAVVIGYVVALCWRRSRRSLRRPWVDDAALGTAPQVASPTGEGSLGVAAAIGVVVFFGLWQVLTIRPQTISLLLFVFLYDVLERAERNPRWLIVPPFVLALWANVHGAFPAGIILMGCFGVGRVWEWWRNRGQDRQRPSLPRAAVGWWFLCGLACVAATLVNPYGWHIYDYVLQTSGLAAARRIDEWLPPSLDQPIGLAFFVSVPILLGLAFAAKKRNGLNLAARDVALLAVFFLLAIGSIRMVAWWLIVIAPLLAQAIAQLCPRFLDTPDQAVPKRGAALVVGVMAILVILGWPALQPLHPVLLLKPGARPENDLAGAQQHLAEKLPQGRVFTRFEWAEYLGFVGRPHHLMFMDGRIEIFPDPVWNAYAAITTGQPDWERLLADYQVDALVLDAEYHAATGLLSRINASSLWHNTFR
jgi:hypothetical protein